MELQLLLLRKSQKFSRQLYKVKVSQKLMYLKSEFSFLERIGGKSPLDLLAGTAKSLEVKPAKPQPSVLLVAERAA